MLIKVGPSRARWLAVSLRALRSTLVICVVALVVSAVRSERFQWSDLKLLAARYWGASIAVFVFVLIWDLWFHRTRRPRIVDQRDV
jgi:hypothetical protein